MCNKKHIMIKAIIICFISGDSYNFWQYFYNVLFFLTNLSNFTSRNTLTNLGSFANLKNFYTYSLELDSCSIFRRSEISPVGAHDKKSIKNQLERYSYAIYL